MRLFDILRYAWKYLKITIHAGHIWGFPETREENNALIQSHYPKEWAELQAIRNKYKK